MIFLAIIPAISAALAPVISGATAVVTAAAPVVNAVAVAAVGGAVIGGATCAASGGVSSYREHGELNHAVVEDAIHNVPKCAAEGALVGGLTGGVALVIAPAIAPVAVIVDDVFSPTLAVIDDAANAALQSVDDAGKIVMQTADDAFGSTVQYIKSKAGSTAKTVGRTLSAPTRLWRNTRNADNFKTLPKGTGNKGYVYVMDDVSTPGRYKMGKTTQPVERINKVRSETGLKLDYTCIIGTDDMESLENSLKKEFSGQQSPHPIRHSGYTEWLTLSAVQVAAACSR